MVKGYFEEGHVVNDNLVRQYQPMVSRIANEFGRKFRTVDRDDIEQECWLWFVTHPGKTREWMNRPLDEGDRMFARSLRNAAMGYCVKEKARIEGYMVGDVFWYSKDFIKELLPSVISEDWKRVQASFEFGGGGARPANESGDWMAYAADVRKAYDSLGGDDRLLVDMFYVNDVHGTVLQEATDAVSVRAAEMAANRAVAKMVRFLGGERPRLQPENDIVERPKRTDEDGEDE